jgi:hypothetical protein
VLGAFGEPIEERLPAAFLPGEPSREGMGAAFFRFSCRIGRLGRLLFSHGLVSLAAPGFFLLLLDLFQDGCLLLVVALARIFTAGVADMANLRSSPVIENLEHDAQKEKNPHCNEDNDK